MPGPYKVLRKIADGGMAEIFLGLQSGAAGFVRPVVLKRIRAGLAHRPGLRGALIDEARAAMGLGHSNIVQVLDLGISGGVEYLVLELVHGWDLQCLLRRTTAAGTPLPLPLGVHIASEVCRALAFVHSWTDAERPFGIVHCDVNPHNILVSEEGEVKLTDFGIAVARGAPGAAGGDVVKGKAGFMSPEQSSGEALDARSDLYSLGSTLFLMATGRRPFEGSSDLEALELNKKGRFPNPTRLRSDLPPQIDAVIRKAMQRSPRKRYPGAEAMLADLEQVLREFPERAGPSHLKRWLGELAARDGDRPITRGQPGLECGPGLCLAAAALELAASDARGDTHLRAAMPPPIPADALGASMVDEPHAVPRAG
jgi:serine/threonine protein kinase